MSLFRFGFAKKEKKSAPESERAFTVSAAIGAECSVDAGASPPVALPLPAFSESDSHTLSIIRDPALPVASLSLDTEIKQGPIVMDLIQNAHSGRCFRVEWTSSRIWLEYSNSTDKSYCFPCRLFASNMSAAQIRGHDSFVSKGFDDWKHALSKDRGFMKHEVSELHQTCCEMLANRQQQLLDPTNHPCIGANISTLFHERQLQKEKETLDNRKYIGRLAVIMRLLMRLGLASRGHREGEESLHRGNFRELIELVRESDDFFDKQLSSRPGNAHYLSPESQNDLIEAIGDEVLSFIIDEATNAQFFAIMMDETTDLSHLEQVAIVVRYCNQNFDSFERLLSLTESSTVTGQALANRMMSILQLHKFDLTKLCAQTYDGAAAMSGKYCGCQAIIRQTAPQAHYNHCRSHSSNLVIVKSAQATRFGRNFFGILEQLFVVIEGSAKRHMWFMDAQVAMGVRPKPLKALFDTRWNCQGRSIDVVRSRLAAVVDTLKKIRDESSDRKVIGEAVGLLACITKFEFVLAIEFFAKLLSPLDTLTAALQGPDSTLHTVVVLSNAACRCIEELRENLDAVFDSATQIAAQSNIDTEVEEKRRRKVSRRLDTGENEIVLSAVGELKREMKEITDVALSEMKTRFMDTAGRLYELVGALMSAETKLVELKGHIDALYPTMLDADLVASQFDLVRRIPGWISASDLRQRALACPPSMIELRKLYSIMITVPVTSAECERSFSKLALIKSKLRTTCGQERLEKLVLCSVERDIVQRVNVDKIVDRFDSHSRRIQLS